MERAEFSKKQGLFTCKMDLNLRKNLVNYFTQIIAVCGSEIWTVWKVSPPEGLKCGNGEGWRRSLVLIV